jgi:hypothetical protein
VDENERTTVMSHCLFKSVFNKLSNLIIDEKKKRFEKKMLKNQPTDSTQVEHNSNKDEEASGGEIKRKNTNASNDIDDDEKYVPKNKNPLYDRKIKITGNDDFLKQIFSK